MLKDRWRVTIRGNDAEIRGYVQGEPRLRELADAVKPFGWAVVASPAPPDYFPWSD